MQVKFIEGDSLKELECSLNEFLETLPEDPKTIDYRFGSFRFTAIVEYSKVESGCLCCDCAFWDDKGDNLIGLCQRCGGRKRFSDKACNSFEDRRR